MQIQDGKGTGVRARVDSKGRLWVDAANFTAVSVVSVFFGDAFIWSATADWGADVNVLWLRNDSRDKLLHIERLVACVAANAVVEVFVGNSNTSGGTAVTGTCMNRANIQVAPATCTHTNTNVNGGTGMTLLGTYNMPATNVHSISFDGALVLGYYDEVAINIVTDVASSSFNIHGWVHKPEE
jgi:hypothetical protein